MTWARWVMNRCAIGDYRQQNGVTIARPKQRTYLILTEGTVAAFTGLSVPEAQAKMLAYVADL